jgi:hypothetical protein
MSSSLDSLKVALDLYQAQYTATDKLWGYFSTVTLALVAYTISSDKVSRIFPEALAAVGAYVAFCMGNFLALEKSQNQLVALAYMVKSEGKSQSANLESFTPFTSGEVAPFYWTIVASVSVATFVLVWYRGRKASP